jgi:hypothetical protein
MKAYNVKRNTKVKITDKKIKVPPGAPQVNTGDIITIGRLDDMYCNGTDGNGNKIYIAAWTEVSYI